MQIDPFVALQRTSPDGTTRWFHYAGMKDLLEARQLEEVLPVLQQARAAQQAGRHVVGWISYEAAPAFDPSYKVLPPADDLPLVCFAVFEREKTGLPRRDAKPASITPFQPLLSKETFCQTVRRVQEAIADGETYQVNLTYPGEFELTGSPWDWFRTLRQSQQACHQAYMEFEDLTVLSASPELFFRHADGKILCRPMKGTASPQQMDMLRSSAKDRAENIMIVDMIRNDLGKCAPAGKVLTQSLMDIEHYPSVLQMTSTVSAEGSADVLAWLKALFPCASITGAPKTKTMEWITRLEHAPRGIYTGAIGGFFADGISEFNVAIRTAVHRPATGWVRYHTGCGIVWDSDPEAEYEESLLKTAVLTHRTPPMQLLETMRTDPETGIQHLHRHIDRMRHSAACLGFEWNEDDLRNQLLIKATVFTEAQKVRVLLSPDGHFEVSLFPLPPSTPMRFAVDTEPTPSTHPDLKHKTTHREVYIQARNRCPDVDETLLLNERGELMEFTIGNLVVEHAGTFWTPPLQSGLLPGTARAEWLQNETLQEKTLTPADLETADGIYLLNDVRGLVPMDWVRDAEPVRVTGPLVDVSARHQNQEEGSDRSDQ